MRRLNNKKQKNKTECFRFLRTRNVAIFIFAFVLMSGVLILRGYRISLQTSIYETELQVSTLDKQLKEIENEYAETVSPPKIYAKAKAELGMTSQAGNTKLIAVHSDSIEKDVILASNNSKPSSSSVKQLIFENPAMASE